MQAHPLKDLSLLFFRPKWSDEDDVVGSRPRGMDREKAIFPHMVADTSFRQSSAISESRDNCIKMQEMPRLLAIQ